ncbi:hypothetical protein LUZ62_078948 [Rhynchospora pubera]|uniref:Uncharacterized protein n=1 Tax=Rhynchospora pubera TaxID=906938 RepID=A0AAV8DQ94_9POAL|nr:hypothetical protein LUZ62_078948 [Rhynchospora pubera]
MRINCFLFTCISLLIAMASETKLKLKLLIQKKTQKVLFAEAGKDVVDLLFSLLAMPIGSVIKLITKESMAGSLGATYGSLEQLDDTYFVSSQTKSQLLHPASSKAVPTNSLLLSATDAPDEAEKKYYRCSGQYNSYSKSQIYHDYVTDVYGSPCPLCQKMMTVQLEYTAGLVVKEKEAKEEKGIVKGVATFTIMDDLSVVSTSTISNITLLNQFGVSELSSLEARTVYLGLQEGLGLLKASLQSKTVLTDVFLTKKKRRA